MNEAVVVSSGEREFDFYSVDNSFHTNILLLKYLELLRITHLQLYILCCSLR